MKPIYSFINPTKFYIPFDSLFNSFYLNIKLIGNKILWMKK